MGRPDRDAVGKYLHEAVRRIVRHLKPDRIILFGSHAYGKPTADSDVDLLILLRSRRRSFRLETEVDRLLSDRPMAMDILVRTPPQIAEYRSGFYPLWKEVLERGKVLYAARR